MWHFVKNKWSIYTFQERGQVKNPKKNDWQTILNRIYLKHNINSYDDADDSQSNLTQVFFLRVFAHALLVLPFA